MKLFFIRHKPSGYYLPEPAGRQGRGGSFVEPDPNSSNARIFRSELSAKRALGAWLRGQHLSESEYEDGFSYTVGYSIKPVDSRKREDMEIIMKEIFL